MLPLQHPIPSLQMLSVGIPAPLFDIDTGSGNPFSFNTQAGRPVVLSFLGSSLDRDGRGMQDALRRCLLAFDREQVRLFAVSIEGSIAVDDRQVENSPPFHHLHDHDGLLSKRFGCLQEQDYRRITYVLDQNLGIFAALPYEGDAIRHALAIADAVSTVLQETGAAGGGGSAPILHIPRVFPPDLCRRLMDYYLAEGGTDSCVMRKCGGKTIGVIDHGFKSRSDRRIDDADLRNAVLHRLTACVLPQVAKAFHFHATHNERHVVCCYDSGAAGHFKPHRDDDTPGTAHRRFAVSIVLNAGEFAGGQLRFPEFGPQLYTPSSGSALVFSCSLLHEVLPVTQGRRFVYVPFLYDAEGARIRDENRHTLDN